MNVAVNVHYVSRRRAPAKQEIVSWVKAALADLRRPRAALGVRIVNEAESAALNHRYRGKIGATNVLSFGFDPPVPSDVLGDLVICAPVVLREARVQGKAERAHWAHMVVHGTMHLRGYDHDTDTKATRMERMETRILKRLGFEDPYRR